MTYAMGLSGKNFLEDVFQCRPLVSLCLPLHKVQEESGLAGRRNVGRHSAVVVSILAENISRANYGK